MVKLIWCNKNGATEQAKRTSLYIYEMWIMDRAFHLVSDMCPTYVSLVPVMIIIPVGRNRRTVHYSSFFFIFFIWEGDWAVSLHFSGLGSSNGHSFFQLYRYVRIHRLNIYRTRALNMAAIDAGSQRSRRKSFQCFWKRAEYGQFR